MSDGFDDEFDEFDDDTVDPTEVFSLEDYLAQKNNLNNFAIQIATNITFSSFVLLLYLVLLLASSSFCIVYASSYIFRVTSDRCHVG